MCLNVNIPADAERALREAWGSGLDRAALEALVAEGYRAGKFGISQVCRLLGLEARWDGERWLAERGIHMNYSREDLDADRATLARLFGGNA